MLKHCIEIGAMTILAFCDTQTCPEVGFQVLKMPSQNSAFTFACLVVGLSKLAHTVQAAQENPSLEGWDQERAPISLNSILLPFQLTLTLPLFSTWSQDAATQVHKYEIMTRNMLYSVCMLQRWSSLCFKAKRIVPNFNIFWVDSLVMMKWNSIV